MINAAVLGSPIAHSLSPKIHRKALEILGMAGNYEAFEVGESEFSGFLSTHSAANWSGFSLTMPLKESVFVLIPNIDETTRRINSANTIYRVEDCWHATSTDLRAFENLAVVSKQSKIAIIGGGGTARAAIGSLDSRASSVDVFIRNPKREAAMRSAAPSLEINFLEMGTQLSTYDLVIQTTPAGAFDQYAESIGKISGTLIEALYKPFPTPIAAKFIASGLPVISGRELLVEQALFQVELFTGAKFDFDEMRSALLAEISVG